MSKAECGREIADDGGVQTADELSAFKELQSKGFDVLPLFEKSQHEFVDMQKYSMRTNEKLYNRWREYMNTSKIAKVSAERQEYKQDDFHFHNCQLKYLPSQSSSSSNHPSVRFHLRTGPGTDKYGPIPIPADLMPRNWKQPAHLADKNKTKAPKT